MLKTMRKMLTANMDTILWSGMLSIFVIDVIIFHTTGH